ncbi:Gfo/Idh/MocA family protein [Paenibacillus sp. J22TS3]|uniref:Gfo/Idh/MocA family protein n=1 Tax=Paenibacillus sp. J22TS3 TaxID=2807192 RepID=UPI001B02AA02|nr:Gfo/Idh/MocA family oxidoreductase [Paenibacillus sp. J22TS3]GIP24687.1 oxidoreductase [Paenibacillus sp. J22TS3]
MAKIRVGVIGTGFGASVHVPIFALHEGFEVKSAASVHRGITEMKGRGLAAATLYPDWRQMLEQENLDLVTIASAPDRHCEMALAALQQGVNILCEKPLGHSADQTRRMLHALDHSGVQGFVNFQWRLTPVRQRIKELLRQKAVGEIQHIKYQGSFSGYQSLISAPRGWEARRSSGGGMLYAIGSHMIDSLMWWMEERIATVYAELNTHVPRYEGNNAFEIRDADDAFTAIGQLENGVSFAMDLFYPAVQGNGWLLEVFGTRGTLHMKNDREISISNGGDYREVAVPDCHPPESLPSPASLYYNGFSQMVEGIYRALTKTKTDTSGQRDVPTFLEGHQVQLVMDAMLLSSTEGRRVSVDYSL